MPKPDKLDTRVRLAAAIVALVSVIFSIYTYFASEGKLSEKDNRLQNLGIELMINQGKITALKDTIHTLEISYSELLLAKDSLAQKSDSLALVSENYLNQIHALYDQMDSLAPAPIDAPDSEQLRMFLKWTNAR